ncbi:MAG: glutamate racemase [Tissierellales bacterium]|nr:glutamate racemase [Tissierellales bacterium]MBN2828036.1 glutamate racemase [Tissierellales bacterium]
MRIGIFDSGVGGLTVLNEAMMALPGADFIFYADLDHVPYGIKTKSEVNQLTYDAVDFLVNIGADAVVLACNTATSASVSYLRQSFKVPVIGMEPALKPAVERFSGKKILVMATELTLKEKKFNDLVQRLDATDIIYPVPMPELVLMAEDFNFDQKNLNAVLDRKFNSIDLAQFETLVLGCTHFIYYKEMMRQYFPHSIEIIDGNKGTVRNLTKILEADQPFSKSRQCIEYYVSGIKENNGRFEKYLDFLNKDE